MLIARTLDRDELLRHLVDDEERAVGARIVDLCERAIAKGEPVASEFLNPHERRVAEGILASVPEISYRAFGGYSKAERVRLVVFPQYYLAELVEEPLAVVDIALKGSFEEPAHRDFLGALLGLGLVRGKVGDIILTGRGAQAVLAKEAANLVLSQLQQVGRAGVDVVEIDPERLEVAPERVKEIRTTVASLRLDAVASSGFGTSRTKMVRDIKADRVRLNWKSMTNPAKEVSVGDVISIRGRGRVVVESVSGTTRKGRLNLLLKRYQ